MEFRNLLADDDAVSPVIGVILMVAITVILAAVIGTFVLGLGDQVQSTAPNAQFDFDYTSGDTDPEPSLEITHSGGEGLDGDELYLSGDIQETDTHWQDVGHSTVRAGADVIVTRDTSSGDYTWDSSVVGTSDVNDGTEVRVVWQDSDSDQSSTIRTWTK